MKEKANRQRPIRLIVRVSADEQKMIQEKMQQAGTNNFSLYARKMLIDGYVIRRDFSEIKKITKELSHLARSINQIALRVNETRSIYKSDVVDLQRLYMEVKRQATDKLLKILRS